MIPRAGRRLALAAALALAPATAGAQSLTHSGSATWDMSTNDRLLTLDYVQTGLLDRASWTLVLSQEFHDERTLNFWYASATAGLTLYAGARHSGRLELSADRSDHTETGLVYSETFLRFTHTQTLSDKLQGTFALSIIDDWTTAAGQDHTATKAALGLTGTFKSLTLSATGELSERAFETGISETHFLYTLTAMHSFSDSLDISLSYTEGDNVDTFRVGNIHRRSRTDQREFSLEIAKDLSDYTTLSGYYDYSENTGPGFDIIDESVGLRVKIAF
ncbi:MAG: hypothetical protein RIG84_06430 [Roseovarius sp.]